MPYSHLNDFPADIRARAAKVRLAAFDVDGTLTDGRLFYDHAGRELKAFHVHDGLGLKLLAQHGITVAWITARSSALVEARARELGIAELHQGIRDKLACLDALCGRLRIPFEEVCFFGDDLPDLPVLAVAGLAAAPANAHPWIRERVHWRTGLAGGEGAVRELCDLLLSAQGQSEAILAKALEPGAQAVPR